jgi:hypothetical protein
MTPKSRFQGKMYLEKEKKKKVNYQAHTNKIPTEC